jgi:hypothetical protein
VQAGLTLNTPATWEVRDEGSGRLEISDEDGDNEAIVWPVFLPSQRGGRHLLPLMRTLLERAWPDSPWTAAREQVSGGVLSLRVATEDETAVAMLAWTDTPQGTSAMLYAVRGDPETCGQFSAQAAKAFASVRLSGSGGAGASPAPSRPSQKAARVRFVDPRERAFSLEVPAGWSVEGGLFRYGAVDVRFGVEARSPDRAILVRFGDPGIGTYVTGAIGFPEGGTFSPGPGQVMTVRQYRPPAVFAAQYASQQAGCAGFTVARRQARPDLVGQMNALYQQYGLMVRLDAGDVAFDCGGPGGLRGYWLAALQIVQTGGPAMWKPEYLIGYLAHPSREAEARAVLADMVGTVQVDPSWYQRQTGQAGQVSQVVTKTGEAIARIVNGGYWERTANEPALSVARSNTNLGIEQVENAQTGQRYDVASGANRYWVNPQGQVVGTQTDATPHVDFSALMAVPPGR